MRVEAALLAVVVVLHGIAALFAYRKNGWMGSWDGFNGELIVLAAPRSGDNYYSALTEDIVQFHVNFAEQIAASGDAFIILADEQMTERYSEVLSEEALQAGYILTKPMDDIWTRDFAPAFAEAPLRFRYTAAGQGGSQDEADFVQRSMTELLYEAAVPFEETPLLNDGGNVVDDGDGRAVVSTKFLADNEMGEQEAREALQADAGISTVAFIDSDEQGGLEHADGVVCFVEPGVLAVNTYAEDGEYQAALEDRIAAAMPNISVNRVVTAYDGSQIYDERFGSACGLYTNALVTAQRIYLPKFGIEQDDVVLEQFQNLTSKEVVQVESGKVCHMGGGVRCMSAQFRGEAAHRLLNYADSEQPEPEDW